jgi:predicted RNA binding protein YcfA (HicA-like mRNA interferase family)
VKLRQLVKHLEACGCELYEEGARHSKFKNVHTGKKTTVPRHREIDNDFANDICKQLGVEKVSS